MANVKISQLTANAAKIASTDRIAIAKDTGGGTFASRYVTGAEVNEIKLDTTPQLGGNLDVNGYQITSDNDQDVVINPNGVGIVKIESNLHLRDTAGGTAKQINLYEGFSNGSNYIGIKAPDSLSTDTTYTLPTADGTSGQVLSTNGTGTLSWATAGGGITVGTTAVTSGTNGRVFFQAGGVVQQDGELFWDNTNKRLGVGTSTPSTRLDIQGTASTDSGQLGAELLSTTGWTTTGWTGDFTTGFTHTTGNTSVLSNTLAAVVNTYYQIAYTITGRTAGSVSIAFGGQSITINATGTFGPRATTTGNLTITPTTDFDGTIIISIKVISTYNATVTFKSSDGTVVNEIRNHTGIANTFIGKTAGSRNTTGNSNSFFGASAGQNNTTGIGNSFFGASAGQNNTASIFNSFFGASAGQNNTIGFSNSFFGANAGLANTTGNFNSFFGASAGTNTTTGFGNSSFGQNAGANQTTGIHNIFVGRDSGRYISTGTNLTISNNSIFLGFDTRANADNQTNQIVIGHQAIGLGSNTTVIGNSSTTTWKLFGAGIVQNITAPSSSLTDSFHVYSNDITAGNAAPHFRTENGAIVKVYQETTAVGASTLVSNAGTNITDTDTFDGYTLKQIVKALRNQGLLA